MATKETTGERLPVTITCFCGAAFDAYSFEGAVDDHRRHRESCAVAPPTCKTCNGTGWAGGDDGPCSACAGTGHGVIAVPGGGT